MGEEEVRARRYKKLRRNHLAKSLEDRKYRQRKVDKKYKQLKAKLSEVDLDDLHSD